MTALRVTHVIDGLTVGGAEMMLWKMVSRMDRRRIDNSVITFMDEGPVGALIKEAGIPLYALNMRQGRPSLAGLLALRRLVKELQPRILQTWLYSANLIGALFASWMRAPVLAWNVRGSRRDLSEYLRMSVMVQRACIRLSGRPDVVVVNSELGRTDHAAMGYQARRWVVIPNGFDLERFAPDLYARASLRAELGLPPDSLLIGIVGRSHPMKDHAAFISAARRVHLANPDVHFVMVGGGLTSENSELAPLIADYQLRDVVHLLGGRSDIANIMPGLDIFSLSSADGEGFPNVIGEAMSCGVPCVVTNSGDAGVIVGDTGIVVPPRQPEALAEGMLRLLAGGSALRRRLGEAARARIQARYSIDAIAGQYEELYLSLR